MKKICVKIPDNINRALAELATQRLALRLASARVTRDKLRRAKEALDSAKHLLDKMFVTSNNDILVDVGATLSVLKSLIDATNILMQMTHISRAYYDILAYIKIRANLWVQTLAVVLVKQGDESESVTDLVNRSNLAIMATEIPALYALLNNLIDISEREEMGEVEDLTELQHSILIDAKALERVVLDGLNKLARQEG